MKIDGKLSAWSYFADFFVIPPVVAACLYGAATASDFSMTWPGVFVLGVVMWLAFEYFLHRFVLHGVLKPQHWIHHIRPHEYISVSTTISNAAFFALWLFSASVGATAHSNELFSLGQVWFAGFYTAYFGYRYTHNALHQWTDERLQASAWFKPLHDAHEIHHKGGPYNFGVQTLLLDRVLGTFKK